MECPAQPERLVLKKLLEANRWEKSAAGGCLYRLTTMRLVYEVVKAEPTTYRASHPLTTPDIDFGPVSTPVSAGALFSESKFFWRVCRTVQFTETRTTRVSRAGACYIAKVDELTPALPLPRAVTETPIALAAPAAATPASIITTIFRRPILPAWFAALQVLLVCGIPTGAVVSMAIILGTNMPVFEGEAYKDFTLEFFAMMSLLDTALIALLIRVFLLLSGETSRDVFLGVKPVGREIVRGLLLVPLMVAGVAGLSALLRWIAPWTHTVAVNPFERFMHHPIDATVFIIVVVLAGGVREELQRAFILHRFEQRLGGLRLGLVLYTATFGLLHLMQGVDAAIVVAMLGLTWGLMYIRRRSAVAGIVSHAGFDAVQVLLVFFWQ
jgi:membrane protease YdiL (CAAX protease family)